ncbi:ankyrin repeat and SOCS box protein 2b isoform X1 [Gadus macrocephalus]|uniref:ankyrin repeat and SOCS box protein 2b isoform X1 n=1 Tax=Gadus macrocephalus TaxID=80720 RepID=UPI0028CB428D|nr:ankyrin repeat and SOCS box protein 2b isoform X1 [Gadus macrocephalus]XP_059908356.1 ankyrin repeat and SOCS box protein 2b isoform X1 [Gadus macrocephalus]
MPTGTRNSTDAWVTSTPDVMMDLLQATRCRTLPQTRLAPYRWTVQANTEENVSRGLDPLVLAIRRGDMTALKELSVSHSLTREGQDGWTPLHEAAFCGETEAVKMILKAYPASVDKRTLQEQTALLLASSTEHLACVRSLLEAGADPDICGKNKDTPLYIACERENADMVDLLVQAGASVNQRCARGWTALHQAVSRDNTALCGTLLAAGANLNPSNTRSITPLIVAAQQGRLRALGFLLGKGADVNMETCDGVTALHEASRHGHREAAAMLLERNADANKPCGSGLLPLHTAAEQGHQEIVSLLVPVTSRARLRGSGISPLHLAAHNNRLAAAAVLLRTGADVNAPLSRQRCAQHPDQRTSPLYFAVDGGATETAALLLRAGASLTLDPVSPLLLAARRGSLGAVELLLEHGADANVSVPSYPTRFPGAVALCADGVAVLRCLLEHGCDARACFGCRYGPAPHPACTPPALSRGRESGRLSAAPPLRSGTPALTCKESPANGTQFCEWLSTSAGRDRAGPIVDLLLEYVGSVQLCARITELLDSREDWGPVRHKTLSPRPLLHLSRIRIREQIGTHRLGSLQSLPLPDRLLHYLGPSGLQEPRLSSPTITESQLK